jgi:hypothetical protein
MSDVPLGILLSGGVDSIAVGTLAARAGDRRLATFTISFDDRVYDERPWARETARRLGTDHYELVGSPQDFVGRCHRPERTDAFTWRVPPELRALVDGAGPVGSDRALKIFTTAALELWRRVNPDGFGSPRPKRSTSAPGGVSGVSRRRAAPKRSVGASR